MLPSTSCRSPVALRRRAGAALALLAASALGACGAPQSLRPALAAAKPAAAAPAPVAAPQAATPAARCLNPLAVLPLDLPSPNPSVLMLSYADRVRPMVGAELAAEIARLGDPGDAAPSQMQLAIALANTRAPADLARALGLLQRVIASPASEAAALQPLARALAARYLEQRKVEDERDRQAQQLREAQRRIDQLNDRIEALRAIERSFGRPAAPGGAAPAAGSAKPIP